MNPYFEQTIRSADPVELITLVYQRAVSCVRDAREHLRHKRIAERSAAIVRAYAAIEELLAALQPEMARELSGGLQSLYLYVQQRLLDANIQQADQPLAEVLGLLITLAEAWSGVAVQLAPKDRVPGGLREVSGRLDAGRWAQGYEGTERLTIQA